MWLKVLLQLREYLPHLVRLVPLLENFMATRAASGPLQVDLTPFTEVTENLKSDLGQVTQSHLALSKQIYENHQQVTAELAGIAQELAQVRAATDQRIHALEESLHSYRNWFWGILALLLVAIALLIVLVVVK